MSSPSQTPQGSFNIARPGNTPLSTPGTPQRLSIDEPPDVKNAIIELVKNTGWPSKAAKAQQSLLQAINNVPDIRATTAQLPAGEKDAVEEFTKALAPVHERLKEASTKYGKKQLRKRDKVKELFRGSKDDDDCIRALQHCQTAVEAAGARLQASQVKGDSKLSNALATAKAIFTAVEAFSGPIPVVGQYVGGAAKLGLAIVDMWKGMDSNADAAKTLESRMTTLADHLKYFESQPRENQKEETSTKIRNLQLQLELVVKEIKDLDSKGALSKAFFSRENAESLKEFQEQVKTAENELHLLTSLNTNAVVNKLYMTSLDTNDVVNKLYMTSLGTNDIVTKLHDVEMNAEQRVLLERLGDGSYGAHGNTIEDATCLEGTREGILQRINEWIQDASSQRVLWIYGMAGRGKSTIAATVAHRWRDQRAWAVFHFRRGQSALEKRLVCSLAKQLEGRATPEFRRALLQAIEENKDIAQGRLDEQFKVLLANPLKDHPPQSPLILLVVDALDECEDIEYSRQFVELIDECSPSLPQNVKFVLTTRPEPPIVETLRSKKWQTENLDQVADTQHDIELFIKSEFSKIKRVKPSLRSTAWPPHDSVQQLVSLSEGLFQWARTAMKYISSGSPGHRLDQVLKDSSKLQGLDNLYRQILSNAFEKAKESSNFELLHQAFDALVAAPYPISLEVMAYLFADQGTLHDKAGMEACAIIRDDVLSDVASLLTIPESPSAPIRLMHTSIRDLLIDDRRSGSLYSVALPRAHRNLTQDCFRLMERDLRRNICGLSDLSKPNSDPAIQALIFDRLPSGLKYCCRFWAIHLVTAKEPNGNGGKSEFVTILDTFSKTNFLYWLEVMSCIGKVGEAIQMTKQVEGCIQQFPGQSGKVLAVLWNDAHRFINEFFEPISFGALHIYASALPFCPMDTQLWQYYHDQRIVEVLQGKQNHKWSQNIRTRHVGTEVNSTTISPNGKALALGSEGGTGHLWIVENWEHPPQPMQGHTGGVTSVAFSPDGKMLASGSNDRTVRLWDVEKGEQLGQPMQGHTHLVTSIAFSPDGKMLASGSDDRTVHLWGVEKGEQLGQPMQGHTHLVTSVAFSPDGKMLASGSNDRTVRLWDVEMEEQLGQPMQGHTHLVTSVAFSPNGKMLASGSNDQTVRLWDVEKQEQLGQPMQGHTHLITSVAFSPDGRMLASGSDDQTVCLWDVEKGEQLGKPMQGHTHWVRSVAFSPDGKMLASGSDDQTVRLWNVEKGEQLGQPMQGHTHLVTSVAFSPDGKMLASGSNDWTVRLWDVEKQEQLGQPMQGHTHLVTSVAFSPDGKMLASGFNDWTVQLWDVEKGEELGQPMQGHTNWVTSVAFSPDGKRLASGSYDWTVRLWDVEKGEQLGQPMGGHTSGVRFVAFSPDGTVLASGSDDRTVCLWDVEKGEQLGQPMQGHTSRVTSVAFSPDAKMLASASDDKTVCLWDARKGEQLGKPMQGHTHWVRSVAFSPNGKMLASGSYDQTVRLWDVEKGEKLGQPMQGHTDWVTSVVFFSNTILSTKDMSGQHHWWSLPTLQPLRNPPKPINHQYPDLSPALSPFYSDGHWVTYTDFPTLWLPSKYLSTRKTTVLLESTLVVVDDSISFLDISTILHLAPLSSPN